LKRREARRAADNTLGAIVADYLKLEGGKLRCLKNRRRQLELHVLPKLGSTPVGLIRRYDLVKLFDDIEVNVGRPTADNTLALLRRIFNWHSLRDDQFSNPIIRGMARRAPHESKRTRVLGDDELRAVVKTAQADKGPYGPLVLFLLLTTARLKEAANMTWRELQGSDWILPAARNKVKVDHVRPLSAAALAVLNKLPRNGEYVFSTDGVRPVGGLQRRKEAFDKACDVNGWVPHDLRRVGRTLMSRAGVSSDHAERCLGHLIGGTRAIYDRHEFHSEKQKAFEALARQIDFILNPPAANVRQLPARG
jgi:integrase